MLSLFHRILLYRERKKWLRSGTEVFKFILHKYINPLLSMVGPAGFEPETKGL